MRKADVVVRCFAACLVIASAAVAQTPPSPPAAAVPGQAPPALPPGEGAPGAAPAATPVLPPEDYTYAPDGRRDPFLNLLGTGNEPKPTGRRTDGAAGLTVA